MSDSLVARIRGLVRGVSRPPTSTANQQQPGYRQPGGQELRHRQTSPYFSAAAKRDCDNAFRQREPRAPRPPQLWRKRGNESDVRSARRARAICFGDKARRNFLERIQRGSPPHRLIPSRLRVPRRRLGTIRSSSLRRLRCGGDGGRSRARETDGPSLSRGITEEAPVCQGDYTRPFLATEEY